MSVEEGGQAQSSLESVVVWDWPVATLSLATRDRWEPLGCEGAIHADFILVAGALVVVKGLDYHFKPIFKR